MRIIGPRFAPRWVQKEYMASVHRDLYTRDKKNSSFLGIREEF
jgi:hypothetical protein